MNLLNELFHIEVYDHHTEKIYEVNGNFSVVASAVHKFSQKEGHEGRDVLDKPIGLTISGSIQVGEGEDGRMPIGLFDDETFKQLVSTGDFDMLWLTRVLQLAPRKRVFSKPY
jgi:hypothetical protein